MKKALSQIPSKSTLYGLMLLALVAVALALAAVVLPQSAPPPAGVLPTPLATPEAALAYPPGQAVLEQPPIVNTTGIILLGLLIFIIAFSATIIEMRAVQHRQKNLQS